MIWFSKLIVYHVCICLLSRKVYGSHTVLRKEESNFLMLTSQCSNLLHWGSTTQQNWARSKLSCLERGKPRAAALGLPGGAAVRLQVKSKEWFFPKMVRRKSQGYYKLNMVWLDITGQLYVLLPAFWTIIGIFLFILLAGFRLTVMLITPRSTA